MAINELNQGGQQVSSYAELSEHAEIEGVSGKKVFIVGPDGNQSQLDSLIETLQELVSRLAPLASAMSSGAPALRTFPINTVAVSGPATSAQVVAALLTQTNTLRLDPNNTLAIDSNINNCVGE